MPVAGPGPDLGNQLLQGLGPDAFSTGPDIDSDLSPWHAALREQLTQNRDKQGSIDQYLDPYGAFAGLSNDDVRYKQAQDNAVSAVGPIVAQAAKLQGDDYQRWEDAFRQELANAPKVPGMPLPNRPSILQAALTAFAMIGNPRHAADTGAAMFGSNEALRQQQFATDMERYKLAEQQHQENLGSLERGMSAASSRDLAQLESDRQTSIVNAEAQNRFNEGVLDRLSREKIAQTAWGGRLSVAQQRAVSQRLIQLRKTFDDPTNGVEAQRAAAQEAKDLTDGHEDWGDPPTSSAKLDKMQSDINAKDAQANLAGVRAGDIQATQSARIKNLLASGNLKGAQTAYVQAGTQLQKSRKALVDMKVEWYPKEAQAKLDKDAADTDLAIKRANDTMAGAAGSRNLTSTAIAGVIDRVNDARGKLDASVGMLKQEEVALTNRLAAMKPSDPAYQATAAALDANKAKQTYFESYRGTLDKRLGTVNSWLKAGGNVYAASGQGGTPSDSPAGFQPQPFRDVGQTAYTPAEALVLSKFSNAIRSGKDPAAVKQAANQILNKMRAQRNGGK